MICHPFPPIIDNNCRVLLLGSFPSIDSFGNSFYYGHKRNQFWKLMGEMLGKEVKSISEKKNLLLKNNIALWDMVKSCRRKNSLDANLQVIKVNDIKNLLVDYPKIEVLFFTGQKAHQIYKKHYAKLSVKTIILPSTSPANMTKSYEQKLEIYQRHILPFLSGKT